MRQNGRHGGPGATFLPQLIKVIVASEWSFCSEIEFTELFSNLVIELCGLCRDKAGLLPFKGKFVRIKLDICNSVCCESTKFTLWFTGLYSVTSNPIVFRDTSTDLCTKGYVTDSNFKLVQMSRFKSGMLRSSSKKKFWNLHVITTGSRIHTTCFTYKFTSTCPFRRVNWSLTCPEVKQLAQIRHAPPFIFTASIRRMGMVLFSRVSICPHP